ncbi:hypothetical protein NMG60_11023663 [Bertholletia excelsa]
MASPSRWASPGKAIGGSSIKLSNTSQSSSFNPSIIFTFHSIQKRQTCLTVFSLDSSTSSSSSSPSTSDSTNSHTVRKKSRKSVKPVVTFGDNLKIELSPNRAESPKGLIPSFKSLFGRRSIWRRVAFMSTKARSMILLNVITFVYASNIPVVKEVEAMVDPASFTVIRFSMSAIPFIPFVLRARSDIQTRNAGIELGFWVSLGYLMQALGMLTSDAGRASFISMLTVIVVPLLDGMLGAKIPARTWFGALMSVLGVAMLESSGSPPNVGDLLNFLSAVFFGIHMLRTEHISRNTDKENFLPLLGYEICVIALVSTIWYFLGGVFGGLQESNPSSWTWTMCYDWMASFPWIPAIYTGIFSTGLCLWVEMAAMRDVSATETAIIYGLEPVWGAGFAWFLLGERWGMNGWIGAALVLVGSLMVQIFGSSSPSLAGEVKEGKRSSTKQDQLVSDEKNGFSTSITVSSRKNVSDILKK